MSQNDQHDWFGDMAEAYVGYLAARDGLEVFGAGKWTADLAIHEPKARRLFRVEVRASDRPGKKPSKKSAEKLAQMAEVIAEVTMPETSRLSVVFWKLDVQGCKNPRTRLADPPEGEFRRWLLNGQTAAEQDHGSRDDPLLALAGAFDSEVTDISERHDDYIGRSLLGRAGECEGA